jgi:hypothetical protein
VIYYSGVSHFGVPDSRAQPIKNGRFLPPRAFVCASEERSRLFVFVHSSIEMLNFRLIELQVQLDESTIKFRVEGNIYLLSLAVLRCLPLLTAKMLLGEGLGPIIYPYFMARIYNRLLISHIQTRANGGGV